MRKNNLANNQSTHNRRDVMFFCDKKRGIPVVERTEDEVTCIKCDYYVYCGKKAKPNPSETREDGSPICYSLPEGIYDSINNK